MPRVATGSSLSITQLEQWLRGWRDEFQRLERERTNLARQVDELGARMQQLGGSGGGSRAAGRARNGTAPSGRGGRRRRRRARNEQSLNAVIASVLSKSGKPMKVGDIAEAVQASGYRSNSANFRSIVNQALIKDKRFTAAERGTYQLKK